MHASIMEDFLAFLRKFVPIKIFLLYSKQLYTKCEHTNQSAIRGGVRGETATHLYSPPGVAAREQPSVLEPHTLPLK